MHTQHVSSLNEGELPPSTSGQQAKDPGHAAPLPPYTHRFTHRDVILYHLGLGASLEEKGAMQLLYEGAGLQVRGLGMNSMGWAPEASLKKQGCVACSPCMFAAADMRCAPAYHF